MARDLPVLVIAGASAAVAVVVIAAVALIIVCCCCCIVRRYQRSSVPVRRTQSNAFENNLYGIEQQETGIYNKKQTNKQQQQNSKSENAS